MTELSRDTAEATRGRRVIGGLTRFVLAVVRIVCGFFALVLVAQIVFTFFDANPDKGITKFVAGLSSDLTLGLRNLFTPADVKVAVLVNYGLAAIVWLVIGAIIVRILRALVGRRAR